MNNLVTIIPRSRLKLADCADAARAAGQRLWWNGKALVAAAHKPGADWHRIGIISRAS